MFEFMIADFLDGFSYYTAHFWSSIGMATDYCQGIFETTYSPEEQTDYGMHVSNITSVFTEVIVSGVNDRMAFNNNVDISILGNGTDLLVTPTSLHNLNPF